jgi:hypothetical protein
MAKRNRINILPVFLILALLTGSIPYEYAYCALMKRAISNTMVLRCNVRHGMGQTIKERNEIVQSDRPMLRFLSKSTTDSYDHRVDQAMSHPVTVIAQLDIPLIKSDRTDPVIFFQNQQSPPDIVIRILNLRI